MYSKDFQSKLRTMTQQTPSWQTKPRSKPQRRKSVTVTTPPPSMEAVQPAPKKMKGNVAPPPQPEFNAPSTPLTPLAASPSSESSSFEDFANSLNHSSSDELLSSPMSRASSSDLELPDFGLMPSGSESTEWQYPIDYQGALDLLPAPLYEGTFPFNI